MLRVHRPRRLDGGPRSFSGILRTGLRDLQLNFVLSNDLGSLFKLLALLGANLALILLGFRCLFQLVGLALTSQGTSGRDSVQFRRESLATGTFGSLFRLFRFSLGVSDFAVKDLGNGFGIFHLLVDVTALFRSGLFSNLSSLSLNPLGSLTRSRLVRHNTSGSAQLVSANLSFRHARSLGQLLHALSSRFTKRGPLGGLRRGHRLNVLGLEFGGDLIRRLNLDRSDIEFGSDRLANQIPLQTRASGPGYPLDFDISGDLQPADIQSRLRL